MGRTTAEAQYPDDRTASHDLDPTNGEGDLVVEVAVGQLQSVVIAASTQDANAWSASVDWVDGAGNVYQSESATDIELSSVTEDWARLVRKGPKAKVTFTSEVSDGTQNRIHAYVDGHR